MGRERSTGLSSHVTPSSRRPVFFLFGPASALVLRLRDGLAAAHYETLRPLAKRFEQADQPLSAVACYRALIDQILDAGRSTAYRHARRYLDRLSALDSDVSDYGDVTAHARYVRQLRERHGKKRSFWQPFENPRPHVTGPR